MFRALMEVRRGSRFVAVSLVRVQNSRVRVLGPALAFVLALCGLGLGPVRMATVRRFALVVGVRRWRNP